MRIFAYGITTISKLLNNETSIKCNVTYNGVTFTRALNNADKLIQINGNKLTFQANAYMDYFQDPDGKLTSNTAPILLAEVDNTKPFQLTAKVSPSFTDTGLYNAAALYIFANEKFW